MKVQFQTFRAPRWLGPVLVLIALALIPFALALGLAVMALVTGASVLRFFLPSPGKQPLESGTTPTPGLSMKNFDSSAIDADFEVKEEHEKGN